MAEFTVHQLEGMRYVDCLLNDETVRAEAGALAYMKGQVEMRSPFFVSPLGAMRAMIAEEAVVRPSYTGTGVVTLASSLGGFHVIELQDETWILERGSYWASEGKVKISYHRVGLLTSVWAGEGLVYLQTKVSGTGKVVMTTRGPIERVRLEDGQRLSSSSLSVVAWSSSVKFTMRRAAKNFLGRFTSGQRLVRTHEGPGEVLLNPSPYWRYRMLMQREQDPLRLE
jgi:uncharacterized protein (AIM24 family)